MHMMDCKGVSSIVFGSLLSWVVKQRKYGANAAARMQWINQLLESWYACRPGYCKLPRLYLKNLTSSSGWSDLHGPAVKSAMTRAAAPFFWIRR